MGLPLIGLTAQRDGPRRLRVNAAYVTAVERGGGMPVVIPILSPERADEILDRLDGVLLTGGGDIDPSHYGAPNEGSYSIDRERDAWEIALALAAHRRQFPYFGICRGIQVMAVAHGVPLIQDLRGARRPQAMEHDQERLELQRDAPCHDVEVVGATRTAEATRAGTVPVNSMHHQAISAVPPGFQLTAVAPDGTIEAIEGEGDLFQVGVQWHPEELVARPEPDPLALRLFTAFVQAAASRKGAR